MDVELDRLRTHLHRIARCPRPAGSRELERAQNYVADCLESFGWTVDWSPFEAMADVGTRLRGINLVAHCRNDPNSGGPRFCVGAHLDSKPNSPGADDNASAVATMLEIARLLPTSWPESAAMQIELVAFDLEENGMLGGTEHAQQARRHGDDLRGMVSLEMLGYCDHSPDSQSLPRSLQGLYPDTANFIAIVGNQNSAELIDRFRMGMETVPKLPVETLAVPSNGEYLQATRLSDHSPFWDAGYPALMITDTSFMRNPHYHLPTDTMETLDFEFLTRVAQGCYEAVRQIISTGLSEVAPRQNEE